MLSILVVAFVLSSCMLRRQKIVNGDIFQNSPFDFDERKQLELQLSGKQSLAKSELTLDIKWRDIPMPFDTTLLYPQQIIAEQNDQSNYENEQHMYGSLFDRSFLLDFFNEQLEAFGWQKEGSVSSFEEILVFTKSHKKILISLRTSTIKKYRTIIVISLYRIFNNKGDD